MQQTMQSKLKSVSYTKGDHYKQQTMQSKLKSVSYTKGDQM